MMLHFDSWPNLLEVWLPTRNSAWGCFANAGDVFAILRWNPFVFGRSSGLDESEQCTRTMAKKAGQNFWSHPLGSRRCQPQTKATNGRRKHLDSSSSISQRLVILGLSKMGRNDGSLQLCCLLLVGERKNFVKYQKLNTFILLILTRPRRQSKFQTFLHH